MRRPIRSGPVAGALALILVAAACSDDDGASVRDLGAEESEGGSDGDAGSGSSSGSGSASASAAGASASASASAPAGASASAGAPGPGAGSTDAVSDGGYEYVSDVSGHRLVTDDVCDIKTLLDADPIDFAAIDEIYRQGANSTSADGSMRTLAGFATADDRLHGLDEYHGTPTPLDDWMTEAIGGSGRFATAGDGERSQAVEKGAQNQILVAWAVHELATALAKAEVGDLDPDGGAPHNWDEAWAFYHGASPACAPYATANSRAENFGTLADDGSTALANERALAAMIAGRDALLEGDTVAASEAADEVVRNVVITYSQAAIRYATLVSEDVAAGDLETAAEHRTEGLAFFRVIEPVVAGAGADVEAIAAVFALDGELGATGDGDDVRAALEPAWAALGISDDDIGSLDS